MVALPWSDPNSDPWGDLIHFAQEARDRYVYGCWSIEEAEVKTMVLMRIAGTG